MHAVHKIATNMACMDSCKDNSIVPYSPNPEFSLHIFHVPTDTNTSCFQTMRPHVSACEPIVHQPFAKMHAIGGGAWVVGMAFSILTTFLSCLKKTCNIPQHYTNLSVHAQ